MIPASTASLAATPPLHSDRARRSLCRHPRLEGYVRQAIIVLWAPVCRCSVLSVLLTTGPVRLLPMTVPTARQAFIVEVRATLFPLASVALVTTVMEARQHQLSMRVCQVTTRRPAPPPRRPVWLARTTRNTWRGPATIVLRATRVHPSTHPDMMKTFVM